MSSFSMFPTPTNAAFVVFAGFAGSGSFVDFGEEFTFVTVSARIRSLQTLSCRNSNECGFVGFYDNSDECTFADECLT